MAFADEFTNLKCPHCAGAVKMTQVKLDELFIDMGEGNFTYIGSTTGGDEAKCEHCGTTFVRRQRVSVVVEGAGTINTGGGAFIGAGVSIKGGDFVGRDRVVIIRK